MLPKENLRKILAPYAGDGLNHFQGGLLEDALASNFLWGRHYATQCRVLAESCYQPLKSVYMEFFRLVQQVAAFPLFEPLPDFSWLENFPDEPVSKEFEEFLDAQEFPNFSEFGLDMLADTLTREEVHKYENVELPGIMPVKVPVHLACGILFRIDGENAEANIPPHNIGGLVDALIVKLKVQGTDSNALLDILGPPDFACGGTVANDRRLQEAYETGKGLFVHKCKVKMDETKFGRDTIYFSVIDYRAAQESIAYAIDSGALPGVLDLRRQGNGILVQVGPEHNKSKVKAKIIALPYFNAQITLNMTSRVKDRTERIPRDVLKTLSLAETLELFIEDRLRFFMAIHKWTRSRAERHLEFDWLQFKERYSKPRRTQIVNGRG